MIKKNKNIYFSFIHEQAIVEYCNTVDKNKREQLYIGIIGPVLDELVNKLIFTYKFTSLPNIEVLRDECKIWLVTVLDKFNPNKGFKAFSYFSVISKNWFIHKVKSYSQQQNRESQIEDISKEIEQQYMVINNNYLSRREREEFFYFLRKEIDEWQQEIPDLKENEKKVIRAIQVLFDNIDNIEIFNKKAFYLYIRELTNLSTKQIVLGLIRIKEKYFEFNNRWQNENI